MPAALSCRYEPKSHSEDPNKARNHQQTKPVSSSLKIRWLRAETYGFLCLAGGFGIGVCRFLQPATELQCTRSRSHLLFHSALSPILVLILTIERRSATRPPVGSDPTPFLGYILSYVTDPSHKTSVPCNQGVGFESEKRLKRTCPYSAKFSGPCRAQGTVKT